MDIFGVMQVTIIFIFFLVHIINSIYLKRKNVDVWVLAKGNKKLSFKIVEGVYYIGLLLWPILIVLHAVGKDTLFSPFLTQRFVSGTINSIIGIIIILSGLMIYITAIIRFGESWRVGVDTEKPGALITEGIYSMSRNPMFVCLFLYALGTWLLNINFLMLLFMLIIAVTINYQVKKEEKFLRMKHGEKYTRYMQRVPRYITVRTQRN